MVRQVTGKRIVRGDARSRMIRWQKGLDEIAFGAAERWQQQVGVDAHPHHRLRLLHAAEAVDLG